MLLPYPLQSTHRCIPLYLAAILTVTLSPIVQAESPTQRQELAAALRQLDALERTVAHSATHTPIAPGERYHFDYPRLLADLARVRAGIQGYLTPSRAQPRDLSELAGDYRVEFPTSAPPGITP